VFFAQCIYFCPII